MENVAQSWQSYVLTPPNRKAEPINIHETFGRVDGTVLDYPFGGDKPSIIFDLGPASPGGYPVFKVRLVSSGSQAPVLRIAYSDRYEYIVDPKNGCYGDFKRGTCKYLGVELPVPPANPYRYETYTISESGTYASPLVQGQQRWVKVQLETEGTCVALEEFSVLGVSDRQPYAGYFLCNDDDLNKLWYASTYTAQLASIDNSDAWDVVAGWLAPRGLAKADEVGLSREGSSWTDLTFSFEFRIMKNPGPVSAIGWVLRARDARNCYVFQIDLDGRFHAKLRIDGAYRYIKPAMPIGLDIIDNKTYRICTKVIGHRMETWLNGVLVDVTVDETYSAGRIGFCQPLDKWALVREVRVTNRAGELLLSDDFTHGLSQWEYATTPAFVADGAKRDRLPWIGDLDWAGRNIYYAFKDLHYMKESLELFALNQTPEGYVWATCYPENTRRPIIGEYGYYQSDLFSAWYIPTVADYILFSGDMEFAKSVYKSVKSDADYLWSYVEGDGLHFQRYDTSKGLWSHELEDIGKFCYNNILMCDAMRESAFIADIIGSEDDRDEFMKRAETMQAAIMKAFWREDKGCFIGKIGQEEPCFMANSLSLAVGFVDSTKAKAIAEFLSDKSFYHGKIVSLLIRGLYEYGFGQMAFERLRTPGGGVNWLDAIKDWHQPACTTECQTYPYSNWSGSNWGDCSHPDTAMAHVLSGYMLGVRPTSPGFRTFVVEPQVAGLNKAQGIVPTPFGDIVFRWHIAQARFVAELIVPPGTQGTLRLPGASGEMGEKCEDVVMTQGCHTIEKFLE